MKYVMNSAKNAVSEFKRGTSINYLTDQALSMRYIIFELAKVEARFTVKNYGLGVRRIIAIYEGDKG